MAAHKSAYARLVAQENRLLNCRQDAALRSRDIRRQADEKTAAHGLELRRRYEEEHFPSLDRGRITETVVAARLAEFRASLPGGEDKALAAAYEAELRASISSALPAAQAADAAALEGLEADTAAYAAEVGAAAEKRIAALNAAAERRAARITAAISRLEEAVSRESGAEELPEDTVLSVRGLCMYFGGVKAVDGLSFDVKKGQVFGLIGPNGAGKTTVFNSITQFYRPTAGELLFRNRAGRTVRLTDEKVHDVILQGIVRTFQNVEVIREVTVLENLLIAGHRRFTVGFLAQALHLPALGREERVIEAEAMKVLEFMGISGYRDAYGLPYGVLKKIEIARTLMCSPQLIILDEPAAGLNDSETAELSSLIRRIRDEYGCTVLLVEHDMGLVMDICDTICAISFGKLLATGTPEEIQRDPEVRRAYLGEAEDAPSEGRDA